MTMNSDNKVDKKLNVKRVDAEIVWEGKRKEKFVPEGTHYAPQVQFDGEDVFHDEIVWSSDIIVGQTDNNGKCKIKIKYLAEGAPVQNLVSGNRFKLFEGPSYIAKGVIL